MENKIVQLNKDATSVSTEVYGKYLTFWTDAQMYGVPIADVVQIVQIQAITEIPEFPSFAKGIINLRGTIIPVIDIRLRFGFPELEYSERTCIIIANINELYIGFIVDEVDEVADIADENISAPPSSSSGRSDSYLTGIGRHKNKIILLLSAKRILNADQLDFLHTHTGM